MAEPLTAGDAGVVQGARTPLLMKRLGVFVAVLAVEAVAASMSFDAGALFRSLGQSAGAWAARGSVWSVQFLIGFAAIFCTFLYLRSQPVLRSLTAQAETVPVRPVLVLGHFAALAMLFGCSMALMRSDHNGALVWLWMLAGAATLWFAAVALMPLRLWLFLIRATGMLALYAACAAAIAASAVQQSWKLWKPLSGLTFFLVKLLLAPIFPVLVVQPEIFRIGSPKFAAIIAPGCSGIEGASLLIVFLTLWLILFRKEIRFPQALLLIPVGVALLLLLNAARIAVLILIGSAGWREIATQGFHSQGGWIAFNTVAFGISVGARRVPWIGLRSAGTERRAAAVPANNAVAIYLLPFLAVLLGGMLARTVSGQFEWFYGLRLLCAVVPLWMFRKSYAAFEWKWDWRAIAAGVAVFAFWVGIDRALAPAMGAEKPAALAQAPVFLQAFWILVRAATAVAVVPFAEELAFRGYVMRRFASEDFEAIVPRAASWLAVIASSVVFGLLHGSRWFSGSLAGLVFALVYRRSGRLGSATLAHACTNLLLTIYVLAFGEWSFW